MREPLNFYVQIKGFGVVDKNKKAVIQVEMPTKRIIAEPDAPLATVVALLESWQGYWKFSGTDAAKKDLQRLKDFVDGIEITEG